MKQIIHTFAIMFFIFFLITTLQTLTVFSASKQGEEQNLNEVTIEGSPIDMEDLFGVEDCHGGDEEECLNKRMVAEAHLDYIYTQNHKP